MTTLTKTPQELVATDTGSHHFRDVALFLCSTGALLAVTVGAVTVFAKVLEVAQFFAG